MRYETRRLVVVCAVVAASSLGGLGVMNRATGADAGSSGRPPFTFWLSANRVPAGRVELVGVLFSRKADQTTFGVATRIDRWDGRAWVHDSNLATCPELGLCTGRPQPIAADFLVSFVGLTVRKGMPGPAERFTTEGLDPGRYRLVKRANSGDTAEAIFDVATASKMPAPLLPFAEVGFSVTPVVVNTNRSSVVAIHAVKPLDDVLVRPTAAARVRLTIERWAASRWVQVGRAVVDDGVVALKALPRGSYRLTIRSPAGERIGMFWVADVP